MKLVAVVTASTTAVDAAERLDGVPLLVRAVRALLDVDGVDEVHLLGDASTRELCRPLPVVMHSRSVQRVGDVEGDAFGRILSAADLVVVHDIVWSLVDAAVVGSVVAVAGHGVAVAPAVSLTDTVKRVDASGAIIGTPDRATLRVVQTPQAFPPGVVVAPVDLRCGPDLWRRAVDVGVTVRTVPGDPRAPAVRTGDDLELARALFEGERPP